MTIDLPENMIEGVEELPHLENPPGALRELNATKTIVGVPENPPRIGGYRLVARFRSSPVNDVFVGLKMARFGYSRRGIVKFVPRSRERYDDRSRQLFDEALAIAALDHPNIVKILDVGENELGAFLALEYIDGIDLGRASARLHRSGRRFPKAVALYIVAEMLRGLDHAHRAADPDGHPLNIVHRDVNPSNVLLATTGHVKLADFGMVKMKDRLQQPTKPGIVKGKFRYLAPEYIAAQRATAAADIFSTGVTLFELLVGRPWSAERDAMKIMKKIVFEGLPMADLEAAGVEPDLMGIVSLAVDRDPERRFPSAADMSAAIEAWLSQKGAYVSASVVAAFLAEHALD